MCSEAQTFVDVYFTQLEKKRKKCRRDDDDSTADDTLTQPARFSKAEIQEFIRKEILAAVKQSDQKINELWRRIQKMDCISSYEGRILKLQANIRKIKKREEAALAHLRDLCLSGTQTSPAGPIQSLSDTGSLETPVVEASPASPTEPLRTGLNGDGSSRSVDSLLLVTFTSETSSTNEFCEVQKDSNAFEKCCQSKQSKALLPMQTDKTAAQGIQVLDLQHVGIGCTPALSPTQDEWLYKLPPLPTTLLPAELPAGADAKKMPQKLNLRVVQILSPRGILAVWSVDKVDPCAAPLDSYHIYVTHENRMLSFCA